MPQPSNRSSDSSRSDWLDWKHLVRDDNYHLFQKVLRGCRQDLLEAAVQADSSRDQDRRVGAVQLIDLILSGWMDQKAKVILGLPDEEPEPVPDYMRHEVPPTEE